MNQEYKKPIYSIVAPIYNEKENIEEFYTRTAQVMNKLGHPYEIIFINDGSKDSSLSMLKELHKNKPCIKVLDLSRNFGKEIAMTAGINYASGNAVIPIDTDLQDPPELIPTLITKWQEGYDVVYATRSKRLGESPLKKATAFLFYKVIRLMTQVDIPANTGDFRLLDRRVVDALKELDETNRFMKGLFSWVGFKQTGIEYTRDCRHAGTTKWNYSKLFNYAIEGITSFSHVPLKLASYMGIFISGGAFLYAIYMVITTLLNGNDVPGYPSLIVIILFLGGVQLITIGIIGEYIGRIYKEVKKRKLYYIREKFGFQPKNKLSSPL